MRPPAFLPPAAASALAVATGRAWWVVRYYAGEERAEWQGDWSELPRQGLCELRLHCPDGQVAVVGNSIAAGDRLFQFKVGEATVGVGAGAHSARRTTAQVIGIVNDPSGRCTAWAWEVAARRLFGPFEDSYPAMRYGLGVAATLREDVLGARAS